MYLLLEKLDAIDQKLRPIQKNVRYRGLFETWDEDKLYVGEATFSGGQTSPALFAYERGYDEAKWVIFPISFNGDCWFKIDGVEKATLANANLEMTKAVVGSFFAGWSKWKTEITSKLQAMGVAVP